MYKIYPTFPRVAYFTGNTWIPGKGEMSPQEIKDQLEDLLSDYTDNCGRPVMPDEGSYEGFRIMPLIEAAPNSKCRKKEYFLSSTQGNLVLSKNKIYANFYGSPESYGRTSKLEVTRFDEYFSKEVSFFIRPCDAMQFRERIMKEIIDLFD